jgi:hypothetical protein
LESRPSGRFKLPPSTKFSTRFGNAAPMPSFSAILISLVAADSRAIPNIAIQGNEHIMNGSRQLRNTRLECRVDRDCANAATVLLTQCRHLRQNDKDKSRCRLEAENAALRQQLAVLQRRVRGRIECSRKAIVWSSFCSIGYFRRLSLPKVVSGRIGDGVRPKPA